MVSFKFHYNTYKGPIQVSSAPSTGPGDRWGVYSTFKSLVNGNAISECGQWVGEQFLNGTSAHIRLFSVIHSFSAIHGMVDSHKSWIKDATKWCAVFSEMERRVSYRISVSVLLFVFQIMTLIMQGAGLIPNHHDHRMYSRLPSASFQYSCLQASFNASGH